MPDSERERLDTGHSHAHGSRWPLRAARWRLRAAAWRWPAGAPLRALWLKKRGSLVFFLYLVLQCLPSPRHVPCATNTVTHRTPHGSLTKAKPTDSTRAPNANLAIKIREEEEELKEEVDAAWPLSSLATPPPRMRLGLRQHQPASIRPTQLVAWVGSGSTTLAPSATAVGKVPALAAPSSSSCVETGSSRSPSPSKTDSGSFLWLSSSGGKRSAPRSEMATLVGEVGGVDHLRQT